MSLKPSSKSMFWLERGQVESKKDGGKEWHFYKLHKTVTHSSPNKQRRPFPPNPCSIFKGHPTRGRIGGKQAQGVVWKMIHLQKQTVDSGRRNDGKPTDFSQVRTSPSTHRLPRKAFCQAMPKAGKYHVEKSTLPEIVTKTFSPSSTSICWNRLRLMSG